MIERAAIRDWQSSNAEIRMGLECGLDCGFEDRLSDKMFENGVESLRPDVRQSIANISQKLEELRCHLGGRLHPPRQSGH